MSAEHIKRWKIGDVEVVRIAEFYDFQDDVWVLLKDAGPELLQRHAWLSPHYATPDGRMRMNFQAFVVASKGRRIMVDTCIGNDRKREFDVFSNLQGTFLEDLETAGYPADTIDTVICTHLHLDHCGWNTHLVDGRWVPSFPNARYLFGKAEWAHWQAQAKAGAPHMEHVHDAIEPIIAAGLADFIDPDHVITDEIRLIPTPGHTPGHVSVQISSAGRDAVITGDVVHHPVQMAEPDWENNFDMDKAAGAATRKSFFARYEDKPALVITSHFADPTAGRIVKDGARWRFVGGD
jgi:glyoxylase-like metal-dependent hydrolase (beta-lactamase superfamily II)